jgi:hypothetical protein
MFCKASVSPDDSAAPSHWCKSIERIMFLKREIEQHERDDRAWMGVKRMARFSDSVATGNQLTVKEGQDLKHAHMVGATAVFPTADKDVLVEQCKGCLITNMI